MANKIGDYRTRLVRMVYTVTRDTNFGDGKPSWVDGQEFWGVIDELSGNQRVAYSQRNSLADVEIRTRGSIVLSANDRVRVKSTGEVYLLEGVRSGSNETVAAGYRHTEG